MKKKVLLVFIVSLFIAIINSFCVFAEAGEWVQEGEKWKYSENGTFVVSNWKFIQVGNNYNYYYFDELGYMCVGLKKINGNIYSFNYDGTTNTNNYVIINGNTYKTKNKGVVVDFYGDLDIDAYNVDFLAKKAIVDVEKAQLDAEKLALEEQMLAESKAHVNAEKLGPKSKNQVSIYDNQGPGAILK